ncbi:MAG: type II toxin-antitoxin system RelE/ParE family toxin [Chloroflexi bacterium]|nr:type II toxin-antitoxin system RelE/ParE family toxin [Chloroflexota bacterium]MBU1660160.1 type II toxin-antitoxin system RelE/ParE family toxin [Chloroflexota bacterium]
MPEYAIVFARSARKELEALTPAIISRVFSSIEALSKSPRPKGCRTLRGYRGFWRIRVGDYRVIYSIDDDLKIVDISAIRHRSKAYR